MLIRAEIFARCVAESPSITAALALAERVIRFIAAPAEPEPPPPPEPQHQSQPPPRRPFDSCQPRDRMDERRN